MPRRLFVVGPCLIAVGSLSCATHPGDLRQNIKLRSPLLEPSMPAAPSRPAAFPPVALVWESTARGVDSTASPRTPNPEPRTGSLQRIEPTPGPRPEPGAQPKPGVESHPRPEPKTQAKADPPPEARPSQTLGRAEIDATLSAESLTLPFLHKDADEAERSFHEQAARAVARVLIDDFDDPAILMSLYEKMLAEEGLSFIREDWREPLERALVRAESLQRAAAPLKALRAAFAQATPSGAGLFGGINYPQCRAAMAELSKLDASLLELAVTIPPLARRPTGELEGVCELSYENELAGREFPAPAGPPALRQLVRKAYQRSYKGRTVTQIVIGDQGWVVDEERGQRSLGAVVGVKRRKAFPLDPCVMEEITLVQEEKRPGRYGPPVCCEIRSSVPISCDQIK